MRTENRTSPKKPRKSILKKVVVGMVGFFTLLAVAALVLPSIINVDKYRPQILSKAGEYINGKLELGHLSLSLLGKIAVEADGLSVEDSTGKKVVQVKDAKFHLPLLSLITFRPEVRFILNNPQVDVVKNQKGELNVLTLVKQNPSKTTDSNSANAAQNNGGATTSSEVPSILLKSRYTFILDKANLSYQDLKTGESYRLTELNGRLEDVSPSSAIPFSIDGKLNLEDKQGMRLTGPFELSGKVTPEITGEEIRGGSVDGKVDLSKTEIVYADLFHKKSGTTFSADLSGKVGTDSFDFSKLNLKLADLELASKAKGKTTTDSNGTHTVVDAEAKSNTMKLKSLTDLSPMAKAYNLDGELSVDLKAKGDTKALEMFGSAKLTNMVVKSEQMKQPLKLNASLDANKAAIEKLAIKLEADEFDLNVQGNVQNFSKPRFQFAASSSQMNLDKLLVSNEKAAEKRKEETKQAEKNPENAAADKAATGSAADYNAMFDPIRKNPILAGASGTLSLSIKKLVSTGVQISDLKTEFLLNDLLLAMKNLTLKIFDGSVQGEMNLNLKPALPFVSTKLSMVGLQSQKMTESQMPLAKDTIKGTLTTSFALGGNGLNWNNIVSNWKGSGTFSLKNAVFSTFEIGKQLRDGLLTKLPDFAKSKIRISDKLVNQKGEYESVSMKFGLDSGVFKFNDLDGKAKANEGLDLKGEGNIDLRSYKLNASFDLIDTYNLTNGDQVAKDKRYGHFTVSPKVGGTLFSPQFDWASTIGRLAQSAVQTKGKELIQKAIKDKIPGGQNIEESVKGVFKGLFKK